MVFIVTEFANIFIWTASYVEKNLTLGRNVMRYQQLFKIKIVKIGVWMTSVPVLVVTPILKCCVVMSTLFNQLNTMTSSQSFDPMKTELVSMNGSKMETKKIDNEYDSQESFQKFWTRNQACDIRSDAT